MPEAAQLLSARTSTISTASSSVARCSLFPWLAISEGTRRIGSARLGRMSAVPRSGTLCRGLAQRKAFRMARSTQTVLTWMLTSTSLLSASSACLEGTARPARPMEIPHALTATRRPAWSCWMNSWASEATTSSGTPPTRRARTTRPSTFCPKITSASTTRSSTCRRMRVSEPAFGTASTTRPSAPRAWTRRGSSSRRSFRSSRITWKSRRASSTCTTAGSSTGRSTTPAAPSRTSGSSACERAVRIALDVPTWIGFSIMGNSFAEADT
mmetsp:Transcript_28672/g.82376  ORF Transcript_28672/g.82376 Transcript_28672/m.82376 type:complete len:269 (-) Transcript_28672:169-975(-)